MFKALKRYETIEDKVRNLRVSNWVLLTSVSVALISIFFGVSHNRQLWVENRQLQLQLQSVAAVALCDSARPGDIVPPIEADTLEGKKATISYDGTTKYLFFIFSVKCNHCLEQFSQWSEIARKGRSTGWAVLGLATDREDLSFNVGNAGFEVLKLRDTSVLRAYRITVVPSVILVSEQGRIQWVRSGALNPSSVQELHRVVEGVAVLD
jgi:hypothetical protein